MLPTEIVTQIINYLDIDDIINVLQISKLWFAVSKYIIQKRNLMAEYYQKSKLDNNLQKRIQKNLENTISKSTSFGSYLIILSGLTFYDEIITLSVSTFKPDILEFMVETGKVPNNVLIGHLLKLMNENMIHHETIKWLYLNYVSGGQKQKIWIKINSKMTNLLVEQLINRNDFPIIMKKKILPNTLVHNFLLGASKLNYSREIKWCFIFKYKFIIKNILDDLDHVFYHMIVHQNSFLLRNRILGIFHHANKIQIIKMILDNKKEECLDWAFANGYLSRTNLVFSIIAYIPDIDLKNHIDKYKITKTDMDDVLLITRSILFKDISIINILIELGIFVMNETYIDRIFSVENPETLRYIFDKYQHLFIDTQTICIIINIISRRNDKIVIFNLLITSMLSIKEIRTSDKVCQALLETYETYVVKNLMWRKYPITMNYLEKCLEHQKYALFIMLVCNYLYVRDYSMFAKYITDKSCFPVIEHVYNCSWCFRYLNPNSVELIGGIYKKHQILA